MLNRAYNDVILELYDKQDWSSLQTLLVTITYTPTITTLGNGQYTCPLPGVSVGDTDPKFWLYVDSLSKLYRTAIPTTGFIQSLTASSTTTIRNKVVTPKEFNDYSISVFNTPIQIKEPVVYISNNTLKIQSDTYTTIDNIQYVYIKKFTPISDSVSCGLQESIHMNIVTLAVNYGIKSINSKEPQNARNN